MGEEAWLRKVVRIASITTAVSIQVNVGAIHRTDTVMRLGHATHLSVSATDWCGVVERKHRKDSSTPVREAIQWLNSQ